MCIAPRLLPNPWYCQTDRETFERRFPYWFLHDTKSFYMRIPCGVCIECLQARQNEFVQRCYYLGKYSYVLFGTLTYQNDALPYMYVNGYKLKFADIRDFSAFMHRLRKSNLLPEFRYLAVTEYGDDKVDEKGIVCKSKHRPHFHFLIFIPYDYLSSDKTKVNKFKGFEYAKIVEDFIVSNNGWSRNYGDSRNPIFVPNSQFIKRVNSYTYDCHYVTGEDDNKVAYYVTKYVLKFSNYVKNLQSALRLNLTTEEYNRIWSVIRPKLLVSKGVGYKHVEGCDWAYDYIDECIDKDISDQIDFFAANKEKVPLVNIDDKQVPLCQYYIRRLMTMKQRVDFHNNRCDAGPFDDEYLPVDVTLDDFHTEQSKIENKFQSGNKLLKKLQNNQY